jgi:hypothetical protein
MEELKKVEASKRRPSGRSQEAKNLDDLTRIRNTYLAKKANSLPHGLMKDIPRKSGTSLWQSRQ